jgi:predicted MPP superfamily phosphohydrolase
MGRIIFISVFLAVLALANLYVYRRFFCQLSPRIHRTGGILMGLIMGGELLFVLDLATGLFPESLALYIILSSLLGATFMLFVVALIYDLTVSVSRHVPFDQERRRTIKVIFDAAMLFLALSYLALGFYQGSQDPKVNDVVVNIKEFPFSGFTIVQLTDVHIGRTVKGDFLERIVTRTNAMHPNMVVITGDLYDLPPNEISKDLAPLRKLNAPTYFVTGNHEYFHGVESIMESVSSLGITPLSNKATRLGNNTDYFNLVGLNDITGLRFDLHPPDADIAYQGVDQSKPTIVLSHQPRSIFLVENKRCDLMLSGHTHGGQIFPFGLLVKLAQPFVAGLHEFEKGKQIFVSRGTGYWGPPLRFMAPSEISRIVITN